MSPRSLNFYFDYISPYAYFSWRKIHTLCERYDIVLNAHPVVFGKLLDHWGQLGPAEVPPKKTALYKYCDRYAKLHGFEFNPPACHPYNPLPALRLSLQKVSGAEQHAVISAIFEAGWSKGADLSCRDTLAGILDNLGLDSVAMLAAIERADIKALLQEETSQAISCDVFGVPAFIIDDELFWGNDQLEHIELYLQGNDPLDPERVEAMLARHRGIDRKTFLKRGTGTD
ncbi:2-hydroxychromene-2-carboxylate isomerase [Amphritea balenae]|uniref:2-hydroxychromene-2-carboxylate isomerase n=1 Tax=Amphritea balenae TaxID=452629 RepID=A0A3P1SWU5_9GAMM|nr:2-hydroxychromene-2-carboxylate isomerase [Amphritea balenae]RRD01455.1 2-hydroxychromene-2-carboxylate isomerase [Amphritea balenae]GGK56979.1 2-hydroxychromene-2-carboxylate isomerase [Amphritea balenae]